MGLNNSIYYVFRNCTSVVKVTWVIAKNKISSSVRQLQYSLVENKTEFKSADFYANIYTFSQTHTASRANIDFWQESMKKSNASSSVKCFVHEHLCLNHAR